MIRIRTSRRDRSYGFIRGLGTNLAFWPIRVKNPCRFAAFVGRADHTKTETPTLPQLFRNQPEESRIVFGIQLEPHGMRYGQQFAKRAVNRIVEVG
jgi:hypothetical protein